ncbi:MAX gene-associated protein isoform X2 [Misgurnus anguillicaudatus]|uniref:MAX gene-associated protein isoform X2 n=1 Tax=Misgurnus anguillicaudatus TaxID=75329 RepID=UPI003CCFCEF8
MKSISKASNIDVVLENESVWSRFHSVGTEMIVTEQGRRMFPCCRFRLSGLDPKLRYLLLMDVVPLDDYRHRWNGETWEPDGPGEPRIQSPPCFHPESPALGQYWMDGPVSFYKVKLTHGSVDQDACVDLRPMHRYQPRLYIVPVSVGHCQAVSLEGPEVQMFTFTKTEFYAVTSYQNPKMNQLKIDCNPFKLAFREDGEKKFRHAVTDWRQTQSTVNHSHRENSDNTDHISTHTFAKSKSDVGEDRVLSDRKRFISDQLIRCFTRGDSAPDGYVSSLDYCEHTERLKSWEVPAGSSEARRLSAKDETSDHVSMNASAPPNVSAPTSSSLHGIKTVTNQQRSADLTISRPSDIYVSRSVHCRSKRLRRARKAKSKWWSNVKYKKAAVHLGPADVSMRPDLEDVDGMLFVSFGVKEALDVHVVNRRSMELSSASLAHIQTENSQSDKEVNLPLEDIISQQEIILLQHLKKQKNRQIIHPLLYDVGLKLNLLDPAVPVDLDYLGVSLPPPAVNRNLSTSSDVQFVSRARKTDDSTKIKGWKENIHEQSSMDSSINRSAFFSDELEKYLESEAQQICQRAAVLSASSPSPVVYQMPAKSSSYVRTLDSVLQTRGLTAAPLTPSTDSYKLPNVLPSQSAVKRTPRNHRCSRRSRQTTPATVSNRLKPRTTRHSPQDRHPTTSSNGEERRPLKELSPGSSFNDCGRAAKRQKKLFEHEQEAVFQGKSRTCVTTERAKFALSSLLTSEKSETTSFGVHLVSEDVCGNDFCRLGCVCESLNRKRRGPLHCRRLQCMFGCDCFKHKVFLIHPPERGQAQIGKMPLMAFTIADPKLKCRPDPAPTITSLWNRRSDDDDTELVFTPAAAPALQADVRSRVYVPRPNPVVQELEKDPVYMYLESKMTCARVREYNSNPPPQFHILPVMKNIQEPDNKTSEESGQLPTHGHLMSPSSDANPTASRGNTGDPEPTKVLEIISECNWEAQRSLVLKQLFHSIKMDLLSSSLFINIYKVDLLSTTLKNDEGRCTLNYKVCISLRQMSRLTDEPKKITNERKITNEQTDVNSSVCHQIHKCSTKQSRNIDEKHVPLQSCVVPAGCLKARMKTPACARPIQVNGKTYSQAKLFLGQMGSLHPTNRLAAYVTGRMKQMSQSRSQGRLISAAQPPDSASNSSSTPKYITSRKPRLVSNIIPIFIPPPKPAGSVSDVSPPNLDQAPAKPDVVVPASALPPGQQVVLQPVPGVSGANICQFNGQMIQLVPLPTVLPVQLHNSPSCKGNTEQEPRTPGVQLPQMIQPNEKSFSNPLSFITPKTFLLPGLAGLSFTSGTTVHSLQNGHPGKPGMFSFRICPPAKNQTGKPGETDSTILLPGGYRLIKLPSAENSPSAFVPLGSHLINKCTTKSSQDCEGPLASNDSIQTDYPVTLSKSKTLTNNFTRETDNSSSIEPNVEQKNQIVSCPDKDSTSRLNAMSPSRVEDTNEGPMRHKSSVHIKTEPSEIPTNPNEPEHRLVSKDVSIKIEPHESKTEPVDNPANTDTLFGINPDNTEQSDDENFFIIKVETCDETSGIDQYPDHTKNNRSPEKEDSTSSRLNTDVQVQPPGNSFPLLKTGDGPVSSAVFRQSINGPRRTIRSFIFSDTLKDFQLDSRDNKVEIRKWPFKRKQPAENSDEEDEEEAQDDCNSSVDGELSSSFNDSDNIPMCFGEDWTTDDSNETCSEEDIDIETYEENNERMNIFRLRAEARRKSQKVKKHRRRPRDKSSGFKARRTERDAVERASDLCVYKRAWHLNQSARNRKRRMKLHQYFISLYRTVNVKEQKMNIKDVLDQARQTIEALERCSRSLMDQKKSLLQKQSNYNALISQLSATAGTILQEDGQQTAQETHLHKHSVVSVTHRRPVGLPKLVLQSFNNI